MKYFILLFIFGLISCSGSQNLSNEVWRLSDISGEALPTELLERPIGVELRFKEDGSVVGFAGCNNFFGKYSVSEDNVDIVIDGTTMSMCENQGFEDKYLEALNSSFKFKIKGDKLIIKGENQFTYQK